MQPLPPTRKSTPLSCHKPIIKKNLNNYTICKILYNYYISGPFNNLITQYYYCGSFKTCLWILWSSSQQEIGPMSCPLLWVGLWLIQPVEHGRSDADFQYWVRKGDLVLLISGGQSPRTEVQLPWDSHTGEAVHGCSGQRPWLGSQPIAMWVAHLTATSWASKQKLLSPFQILDPQNSERAK